MRERVKIGRGPIEASLCAARGKARLSVMSSAGMMGSGPQKNSSDPGGGGPEERGINRLGGDSVALAASH